MKEGKQESSKVRLVKIHGDPMKPGRVTGYIRVSAEKDNGGEYPPTLPDGTPLLTKAEKMAKDFEEAGEPMKGSE